MKRARNAFFKGHGLGNDYLVMDPADLDFELTPKNVRTICDRHFGVGADGILAPTPSERADFGVRIFNPDGSESEKSGNGLRIYARYLHATRRARRTSFTIDTVGGVVTVALHVDADGEASAATVAMGRASFRPRDLPCALEVPELVDQPIQVAGYELRFTGVSVGNPHCVVFKPHGETWMREDLRGLGPVLGHHSIFPNRVNVQLAVPTGEHALSILIWERGVGETTASGSSACAAAAAAVRRGLVKSPVAVESPGGVLEITVSPDFQLTMKGPVVEVARGTLSPPFLRTLKASGNGA